MDLNLLPQELLVEILYLLPVKSLGICKCVSKSWHSLISHPHFIKTHLSKQTHHHQKLLLISRLYKSLDESSATIHAVEFGQGLSGVGRMLNFRCPNNWDAVLGSCNGLVLGEHLNNNMFVLNPTTLQANKLEVSPFHPPMDPYRTMVGFGFDAFTNDYKLVSLHFRDTPEHDSADMVVDVYMLRKNIWRRLQFHSIEFYFLDFICGVFVNGSLHWLTRRVTNHLLSIVAFDLTSEEFSEVAIPIGFYSGYWDEQLAVLGGCLCLLVKAMNRNQEDIIDATEVWMMKEYGVVESWTKFSVLHGGDCTLEPWCLLEDNKKVVMEHCGFGPIKLVIYNLEDHTSRDMVTVGVPTSLTVESTFVESLVSPFCDSEIEAQREDSGAI